ncbi:MAG: hypothetical protein AAGJ10_07755 [Bacteroidota bacterium]
MRYALALFVMIGVAACATPAAVQVRTDAETGVNTYTSSRVTMGHRSMGAGLAGQQRVMWQAVAACEGEACVPDEVELIFVNSTSQDLNLDYRRLEMVVDGTSREWVDPSSQAAPNFATVPTGEFLRVTLTRAEFVAFAEAEEVELRFGETGSTVFAVNPDRRALFREFAAAAGLSDA